jgi:uncharacterized protein YyaL (SSP411 family)
MAVRQVPRTRHFNDDGTPRYRNRLADQTSPYLRQHAHNPVQWWPWGDDAFDEAKRRDVPVFLSVGYSTCHWCHVMEDESFEDEGVAAVMNENFVCIKLDREERPDIDAVYMAALSALTGRGGWPMSVWLTPDTRRPFFAGTYFPARDGDRGNSVGFMTVLERIAAMWQGDRARVVDSANAIVDELKQHLQPPAPGDEPGLGVADEIVAACAARFDREHGGVGAAPKFPSQTPLRLLMRHSTRTGRREGRDMALMTLHRMITGGIFDHLGGGFHRYSVDEQWLVPHFEKMLYDNALLVPALVEAWQVSGDDVFRAAALHTLSFMGGVLGAPDGTFYSATDADSPTPQGPREEGYFFTWTLDEVQMELGLAGFSDADIAVVADAWDISAAGNFEGRSILWHRRPLKDTATRRGRTIADVEALLSRARPILTRVRDERPAPLRDDKIITAWNGLAISAFAFAGFAFDDDALVARAVAAFDAVSSAAGVDGRFTRTASGSPRAPGTLDDHAYMARAAIDLFEATGRLRFLDAAVAIDAVIAAHFEDVEHGGFFVSAADAEALLVREKPDRDGAEPSGNSVHIETLFRLAALTDNEAFRRRGDRGLRAFGQLLQRQPMALTEMVSAIELDHAGREIVVSLPDDDDAISDDGAAMIKLLRRRHVPSRVLVWLRGDDPELQVRVPVARERGVGVSSGASDVVVYVCDGGQCQLPVRTARDLMGVLNAPNAKGG